VTTFDGSHGIQDVKQEDYRLHMDASMDQPPFSVTIPYPAKNPPAKETVLIDLTDDNDDDPSAESPELEYLDMPSPSCIIID
jgi:hypothetical protein